MQIRKSLIFALCLLFVVTSISCDRLPGKKESASNSSSHSATEAVINHPDYIKTWRENFLLKPDRRFLRVIAYVHYFFTNQEMVDVQSIRENDRWHIVYRDQSVGDVPDLPSYEDYKNLIANWVKNLEQKHSLSLTNDAYDNLEIQGLIDSFEIHNLMEALNKLNAIWRAGTHSAAILNQSAEALTSIVVQLVDKTGMADEIFSRAYAVFTIADQLTDKDLNGEEILLTSLMGYSAATLQLAAKLPDDHPLFAYVINDPKKMMSLTDIENSKPMLRFITLEKLAEKNRMDEWIVWMKKYFSSQGEVLLVSKSLLDMGAFNIEKYFVDLMPLLLLAKMVNFEPLPASTDPGSVFALNSSIPPPVQDQNRIYFRRALGVDKASLINRFTEVLDGIAASYQGPFIDSAYVKNFYQSYLYSSLYIQGLFYIDSLSSNEMVREFKKELAGVVDPIANEFLDWYEHLAQSKLGGGDIASLSSDIVNIRFFGLPMLERTFEEIQGRLSYGDTQTLNIVRLLIKKMDSRQEAKLLFGNVAIASLMDLFQGERLIRNYVVSNPAESEFARIWLASYEEDIPGLSELAKSLSTPWARVKVISKLEDYFGDDDIPSLYHEVFEKWPEEYSGYSGYSNYLIKKKRFSDAREIALKGLNHKLAIKGLEQIKLHNIIADSYLKEGLYQEGFDYIEPFVEGMQGNTIDISAQLLQKLGRDDEAERRFLMLFDRYPDTVKGLSNYVGFLWDIGRYQEASELLKRFPFPFHWSAWRSEIGKQFSNVFGQKNFAEAEHAFSFLINAGFDSITMLSQIPTKLKMEGHVELAFKLNSMLSYPGLGNLTHVFASYSCLKELKGEEEAFQWLKNQVPLQMLNPSSMFIFGIGDYELLWSLIAKPNPDDGVDFVWLLRTAAWLRSGQKEEHHKELIQYYQSHNKTIYDKIARYLLNLEHEESIIGLIDNDKKLCEISYYLGLKAQTNGDFNKASDWFHVSCSTGLVNNGEYRWAYNQLYEWYSRGHKIK